MNNNEFVRLQRQAGMKNKDVERIAGVSDQTVINWRKGHTRIPLAVQTLIRLEAERRKTGL